MTSIKQSRPGHWGDIPSASPDAADELPRVPLAAALGAFSGLIFAVTCIAAAAIYFLKG